MANSELCRIAAVGYPEGISKMRKGWVVQCILLRDDAGADVSLSLLLDNGEEK